MKIMTVIKNKQGVEFTVEEGILLKADIPEGVSKIDIPVGVTKIGPQVFSYCKSIKDVYFPQGLTEICDRAFASCDGLTGALVIPKGVTKIGVSAFEACEGLTGKLFLPDSLATIDARAFANCSGLTGSLDIPDNVTDIGEGAFSLCSGLTGAVVIPNGITKIARAAFVGCKGLTAVHFSEGLTEIGARAFSTCSGLIGALVIPKGVTKIGDRAFYYCDGFTGGVVIPDSVTEIGYSTFCGLSSITSVYFPEGVTEVGKDAFSWCSGFTHVFCTPELEERLCKVGEAKVIQVAIKRAKDTEAVLENGFSTLGGDAVWLSPDLVRQHLLALQSLPDERTAFACMAEYQPKIMGSLEEECCLVQCHDGFYYPLVKGGICTLGINDEIQSEGQSVIQFEVDMFQDKLELMKHIVEGVTDIANSRFEVMRDILKSIEEGEVNGSHLQGLQELNESVQHIGQEGGSAGMGSDNYSVVCAMLQEHIGSLNAQMPSMFSEDGGAESRNDGQSNTRN